MDRQHHCGAVQYGTIKLSTLALASSSTNPDPTLSIQLDTDSDLVNSLSDFKTIVGSALNRDYRWKLSKSFPTKIIISLDSRKNIWRREARGELIFSKWPRVIIHRQSSIRLARELIASYAVFPLTYAYRTVIQPFPSSQTLLEISLLRFFPRTSILVTINRFTKLMTIGC